MQSHAWVRLALGLETSWFGHKLTREELTVNLELGLELAFKS